MKPMNLQRKSLVVAVVVAASVISSFAADLSEYVQDGLVAMWDGYRNQGAGQPHDGTATNWLDTTGTHAFNFYRVFPGTLGLKFSRYQHGGYALLSAESTAATFEQAKDGTVEVVYWHCFQTDASSILRSSLKSGVPIANDGGLRTGAQNGSLKGSWPRTHRLHTISAQYDAAVGTSVALDGAALETSSTYSKTINLGTTTYLGYDQKFDGIIYAIRVYNRKLTAAEIAQNAALDQERYNHRKIKPTSEYQTVDYTAGVTADKTIEATPATGVNAAHDEAVAYIGANPGAKVLVKLAAGTYAMTAPIDLAAGEMIIGEGRDKTFLDGSAAAVSDAEYALRLNAADNLVRGLAVINLTEITKVGVTPHAFYVKKGTVDSCRAAFVYAQYSGGGFGFLLKDGVVTNSLADHIALGDQINNGLCAKVEGGVLTDCELCDTDTNCDKASKGGALHVSGGRVTNCRIHDSGQAFPYYLSQGAVYMDGGTVENCLIYDNLAGNGADDAKTTAGVYMNKGTMRYCTIANNYTFNDVASYSGLEQVGGTVKNCILMNNGPVGNGVVVTGGTFEDNLVDKAVAGHDDNLVAKTAYFTDLGTPDFHIAARASLAVGKAEPIADVTTDFDNVARDAVKPTIGAYEYVAAAGEFSADILIGQPTWRVGSSPTAELAVGGVTDYTKLSVRWKVDDVAFPSQDDQLTAVFEGLGVGYHTFQTEATYNDVTLTNAVTNAVALLPLKVYVSKTGSKSFPYATEETATDSPAAAYAALWKSTSETTSVEIASGSYALAEALIIDQPVRIKGAGMHETFVSCSALPATPITLSSEGAELRDFGFGGIGDKRGLEMSAGLVCGCLVTNCHNFADGGGGGVRMTGGRLVDSEIAGCSTVQMSTFGGGVAVLSSGAVVSNCYIHGNYASYGHGNHGVHGGGVYLFAGLVTHCRIVDNVDPYSLKDMRFGSNGAGVYVTEDNTTSVLRNCLIAGNHSIYSNANVFVAGRIENCTLAGNTTTNRQEKTEGPGAPVVSIRGSNTHVVNTVIWDHGVVPNDIPRVGAAAADITYSCWPEAEEGVDGNTARDPKLKKAKRLYAISSFGSCFRAGTLLGWMTDGATDLTGCPRTTLVGGGPKVDIGCHQVGNDPGLMLLVR